MYCHLLTSAPSIVTDVIVLLVMAWVFPVVAIVVFIFVSNWRNFRTACAVENGGVPRRMMIRFGAICLLLPLPVVAVILSSMEVCSASFSLIIATLPIMIALIFGTQWDIIHVWMIWRRHPKPH
ncbi:hypothetical protein PTI98_009819 [Pleurotus ostreatus]|nr:hypothetical protein PTI98_009819 [Pleurotus ostreatus]